MKTGHRFMKPVGTEKCRSAKRTHTLMVKSSLSTARSGVNARWCRAQHTAPTASELPSISCPTQWARCHHLRSQHFVRGSRQNEQGCDTHPQCPSEKRRKLIFVDSLSYVVHETRLVESFRLRPWDYYYYFIFASQHDPLAPLEFG